MEKKCVCHYFLVFLTVYILTLVAHTMLFSGHHCDNQDNSNDFQFRRVVQSLDNTDSDSYNSKLTEIKSKRVPISENVQNKSDYDSNRSFTDPSLNWCQDYYVDGTCQEGFTRQVPTAVNIGMMKSGTTALDWFIDIHEDISVLNTETYFFGMHARNDVGKERYCNDKIPCKKKPSGIVVDRCPFYYNAKTAPPNIHEINPDMKLLLIVRDPVERMMSHLVHRLTNVTWEVMQPEVMTEEDGKLEIKEKADEVKFSDYYRYLPMWLEYFKINESLLVINYQEFKDDPLTVLYNIESFLELPHKISVDNIIYSKEKKFYCKVIANKPGMAECMSKKKGRTHTKMPPDVYRQFKEYYRENNELFFEGIGQDFGWNQYLHNMYM